jgi:2-keto-4-pentenoate hydratase
MKKVNEEDRPGLTGRTRAVLFAIPAAALAWLTAARAAGRPCPPVHALLPDGDIGAAYAVQSAWVAAQLAAGPVLPVAPGDHFTAEIGGLGPVTAQFS